MKMTLRLILVIALTLTLIGCTNANQTVSLYPDTSLKNKPKLVTNEFTNYDTLAIFMLNKKFDSYEITDYVFVHDDNIPELKAIISYYDKKHHNSCNLAFICGDSIHEICFAVNEDKNVKNYELSDDHQLTYNWRWHSNNIYS